MPAAPAPARRLPFRATPEEYLAFENASPEKHEYWDGWVVPRHGFDASGTCAMAGASPEHNQIATNLAGVLFPHTRRKGCRSGASDQRVRMPGGSYAYPDFVLVCGEPVYSDDVTAVLENPTVVVEIASGSTVSEDRGRKLERYTQLPSLAEYWIVEQGEAHVTQFVRRGETWLIRAASGLDAAAPCEALGADVHLADLYALVDLDGTRADGGPTPDAP